MNIAIFASAFHPSMGGVEEVVRQTAHVLMRRGHRVLVLANRWPRGMARRDEHEGIEIVRPAMRTRSEGWRSQISHALFHRAEQKRIDAELRAWGADLIQIHCAGPNTGYALRSAEALRLPLVLSLHGELSMDASGLFERDPEMSALFREAARRARVVTGVSRQVLEEAEAFVGEPFGARGRVILNGLTLREFEGVAPFQHSRPYLLAIGRHVPQKGFDVLLRAFALLREEMPDAPDLILAGDGPEQPALEALARELKLGESVTFPGRADRRQVAALFLGCEFFVLPSRHEPFGIVNLEAMTSRKAVVASRVGGVPEIITDGENGVLVPPENPAALCEAMRCLLQDPALREKLGDAGHAFAAHQDWETVVGRYLECYEAALREQALRAA